MIVGVAADQKLQIYNIELVEVTRVDCLCLYRLLGNNKLVSSSDELWYVTYRSLVDNILGLVVIDSGVEVCSRIKRRGWLYYL